MVGLVNPKGYFGTERKGILSISSLTLYKYNLKLLLEIRLLLEDKWGWRKDICSDPLPCGPFYAKYVHHTAHTGLLFLLSSCTVQNIETLVSVNLNQTTAPTLTPV